MPPHTHASSSRSRKLAKDRRMTIDNLLYGSSRQQSSTHEITPPPTSIDSFSLTQPSPQTRTESDSSSSIITARRDFVIAITRPSTRRGYLECRLCESEVWGPNGKFFISKFPFHFYQIAKDLYTTTLVTTVFSN